MADRIQCKFGMWNHATLESKSARAVPTASAFDTQQDMETYLVACPAGMYTTGNGHFCTPCEEGFYQPLVSLEGWLQAIAA
jgi:hypothetical protein